MASILARLALSALLLPPLAHAADEIDRSFGSGGLAAHGFLPTDGGREDQAFVACASASNTFMVAGNASSGRRTVVAWLTESGELDASVSADGKHSIAVPDGVIGGTAGACLPDGKILLAQEIFDGTLQGDGDIRLTRLLPGDGTPDPAFGNAGTVSIDLDQFAPAGPLESPIAINLAPDGDILLGGEYSPTSSLDAATYSGFLARIDAQTFAVTVAMGHAFDPTLKKFTGAGIGSDGTLWVVADDIPPGGPRNTRVIRLDSDSLAYLGVLHASVGTDTNPGRAVMRGSALILSGIEANTRPFVALVTQSTQQLLRLPAPPRGFGIVAHPQIALLSPHTLFLGAGTYLGPLNQGEYFARIRVTSQDLLRLDESYGRHGMQLTNLAGSCGTPPAQNFQRFTLWRGRPIAVGMIDRSCGSSEADYDYKVTRLLEPGFGHGFE